MLWALGRREEALEFRESADKFKKRFDEASWVEKENLYALGLDGKSRQIKSAASNAAHCLGAGIVDHEKAVMISDRLMQDDMFSGWGMRTLSARHPAYDPYSYHRGSVWPVEQGALASGLGASDKSSNCGE